MRLQARRLAIWLSGLTMLAGAGVMGARTVQSHEDMATVSKMTEKMKTVCVGRFLIDLPEQAQIRIGATVVNGFDVSRSDETAEDFARRLIQRERSLTNAPNMLGKQNIESVIEVRNGGSMGKVYVHGRERTYSVENERRVYEESVAVEGHIHEKGVSITFEADTFDPLQTAVLPALLKQVTGRAASEIPREPGFCIDGALIRDGGSESRSESTTLFASMPGYPDVHLVLWTNAARIHGPLLVERNRAAMDAFSRAHIRILREGPRTHNGLVGEEVALRMTESNLANVFSVAWETRGTDDDLYAPHLSLELDSGIGPRAGAKPVQSSLSEEAMLMLWDKVSSSIRPRERHE